MISRLGLVILLCASSVHAQSPLFTFGASTYRLGPNTENRETPFYRVGPFGWLQATMHEQHGVWYYPTPNDRNPEGYFSFDPHNGATADFNRDGRPDVVAAPMGMIKRNPDRHLRRRFNPHRRAGIGRPGPRVQFRA